MTKRNYLISCLWAIAIMLATVSCSKDEININLPPDETPDATLKVQILPVENNTKTLGHGDNNYVETQVTTAVIGIFKTDGTLKTIRNATFATGAVKELTMPVKSGESLVYVVANVDVSLFDKVNNLTEFKNVALQLDQSVIPMVGNTTAVIIANATVSYPVYLSRMVAKVSVSKIELELASNGYPNATLNVDKVFLHNAAGTSTVDLKTSNLLTGLDTPGLMNFKADYFGAYERHYFYSFESKLRLVIGGWFKDAGRTPIYTYYPVDIDAKHNNHYALTVKIKGLGVENPGDNWEASGNLKLVMQVVDWESNPIDEEF